MIYYAENVLGTKTSEFIESYAEGKLYDINTFLREMKEEYGCFTSPERGG